MTERFNVSGALLVKLFGNRKRESAAFSAQADGLRAVGVRSAVIGRTFYVVLGLIGSLAAAAVYWVGGHQVIDGVDDDRAPWWRWPRSSAASTAPSRRSPTRGST